MVKTQLRTQAAHIASVHAPVALEQLDRLAQQLGELGMTIQLVRRMVAHAACDAVATRALEQRVDSPSFGSCLNTSWITSGRTVRRQSAIRSMWSIVSCAKSSALSSERSTQSQKRRLSPLCRSTLYASASM